MATRKSPTRAAARQISPGFRSTPQGFPNQRRERQMEMVICGQHVARRHHLVAARQIADIAPRFAHEQYAGGYIPGLEAEFPEPVISAGGNISEIECCR